MTRAISFALIAFGAVLLFFATRDSIYEGFHGYVPCAPGTHHPHHVVDTYDLSPLGGGEGVPGHKLGDVIPVPSVCWPDNKPE